MNGPKNLVLIYASLLTNLTHWNTSIFFLNQRNHSTQPNLHLIIKIIIENKKHMSFFLEILFDQTAIFIP